MSKGTVWPCEWTEFKDTITGLPIKQLTNYMAHNFHLYFTNNGWYDNGSKLLFGSDRGNCTNLYSLNLINGEIIQLTDLDRNESKGIQGTYINPVKNEAYFTLNSVIISLNLDTYDEKEIFTLPEGYQFSNLSCTSDGKYLCFGLTEDLSKKIKSNLSGGYVGFEEMEEARPHCQIYLLSLETGVSSVVHEEKRWIGHVNASPTKPNLITFCHEGPWERVDHRIWVLNIETDEFWKLREGEPNQFAGHEYWHADGIHIGYHGFTDSLERKDGKFIGFAKFDNSECEDFDFPYQNMHIHSNDSTLIVGDGQQSSAYHGERYQDCIFLWRNTDHGMEGPRILCKHRASFQVQQIHVHPRLSPDGTKILFTSDQSGYGNVYLVDVPDFETLPKLVDGKLVKS
ncbi:oligogalacturonate lyase family protein [Bacillus sp. REN16]|uniref:oligogalacturonate lyase family protein n=1 Tax=Bacillus sp. REN16 TaxID=2887296 RepID=UPI001E50A11A|nr:oligogalacturonate lyase family protein [Bacillus sp. REN16]MCC3355902.1 oligogalacturonate lyase family protein [Bacillus sp. REN16]